MAKKVVNLYIDDAGIRLLVTHGKRIKKWADLPLEPNLVKDAVIVNEEEVAARIKQLLKAQKASAKKVIVGVSGLRCLTRPLILPQLPKVMLAEAVKREAKRVLPVPLEQLYISWQTIPAPEEKIQVFLVAVPCKAADALFRTIHQAGLKVDLLDLKPLVLARLLKETTAVVVDVQPTEFDIVIMAGGVPQPVRTVSIPGKASSWQEKLPMIRNELDRTIKFFNSNNPENPLDSSINIFASGELADEPELCQSLSDELGYPVLPLPSPLLKCPEGLDPNHYMVNIGMTLKKLSPGNLTGAMVTNLNIMPERYRTKPLSLTRVFALPAAAIAIGLLVPMVMLIQNASADIDSVRGRLDTNSQFLQQRLDERQAIDKDIAELQQKIAAEEAAHGDFTNLVSNIEEQSNGVNGDLSVIMSCLPPTIRLTSLKHAGDVINMRGWSTDEREVLSYLRALDRSERFSEIIIERMKKVEAEETEDGGVDFTLVLNVAEEG